MAKNWFVHIGGETFGPLTTEIVRTMLRQTRLQFTDFIWQRGFTKWTRISEVEDFAELLPAYPKFPFPSEEKQPAEAPLQKDEERSGKIFEKKDPEETHSKKSSKLALHPRFKVKGTIHMENGDSFKIVDLSEGGVFLASKKPMEVGTELIFSLEASGIEDKLKMTGVVIRNGERHDETGFAIEFIRVNPAYKRVLRHYLAEKTTEDG